MDMTLKSRTAYSRNFAQSDVELFPERLRSIFSDKLYFELKSSFVSQRSEGEKLEEIRIRRGRYASFLVGNALRKRNILSSSLTFSEDIEGIFRRICDGSLYAYSESISKGYIALPDGIRIGVCGRATVEDGRIIGVHGITSMNIRIPRRELIFNDRLIQTVRRKIDLCEGVLIFSRPSVGKTTCLRSLAYALSYGKQGMRVAVVDTREELSFLPQNDMLSIDFLLGYPKAEGIRMATFFMNPSVIICDEIGGKEEAGAIIDAQNCGVPLVASAHGNDIASLMRRPSIYELHKARVFGTYISLSQNAFGGYDLSVYDWEEAQRWC